MRIYVTGATGLLGRRLVRRLTDRGDSVVALTRDRARAEAVGVCGPRVELVKGDLSAPMGAWRESVAGCDAVVNLAGEPIFGRRWTEEQKTRIRESRIAGTRMVVAAIGGAPADQRPKALVSASAVGYYGSRADDAELSETAHAGSDFLAKVCVDWEEAARGATAYGTRVVVVRTGIVLDREGGALAEMLPIFRRFLGGPIGAGTQWFPWIHAEDEVGLVLLALDSTLVRGPLNATAPNPVRMKEFAKTLGAVLHRPAWLKAPEFAIRLKFGEAAEILIGGQRVVPTAAQKLGYAFRFPELKGALEDLVGEKAAAASK